MSEEDDVSEDEWLTDEDWDNLSKEDQAKSVAWKPMIDRFKDEVHKRADEIDKDSELCWLSLTAGWALAQGMPPEEAYDFALHIRYRTDLG
ncbi:MAG: hypothetical protein AB7L09_02155 [Nitrospira sp.]